MQKDVTMSWGTFDHGRAIVTESSAQIITTDVKCENNVTIKAASGNTGTVYIGNSDVTAATNTATDGYELAAGQSVVLKINNVKNVYAIGSVNPQTVYWIAV